MKKISKNIIRRLIKVRLSNKQFKVVLIIIIMAISFMLVAASVFSFSVLWRKIYLFSLFLFMGILAAIVDNKKIR